MSDPIQPTTDPIDDAVALDAEQPHLPIDEREREQHDTRALPPNPHADTAYGAIRGADAANPETSATD